MIGNQSRTTSFMTVRWEGTMACDGCWKWWLPRLFNRSRCENSCRDLSLAVGELLRRAGSDGIGERAVRETGIQALVAPARDEAGCAGWGDHIDQSDRRIHCGRVQGEG